MSRMIFKGIGIALAVVLLSRLVVGIAGLMMHHKAAPRFLPVYDRAAALGVWRKRERTGCYLPGGCADNPYTRPPPGWGPSHLKFLPVAPSNLRGERAKRPRTRPVTAKPAAHPTREASGVYGIPITAPHFPGQNTSQ